MYKAMKFYHSLIHTHTHLNFEYDVYIKLNVVDYSVISKQVFIIQCSNVRIVWWIMAVNCVQSYEILSVFDTLSYSFKIRVLCVHIAKCGGLFLVISRQVFIIGCSNTTRVWQIMALNYVQRDEILSRFDAASCTFKVWVLCVYTAKCCGLFSDIYASIVWCTKITRVWWIMGLNYVQSHEILSLYDKHWQVYLCNLNTACTANLLPGNQALSTTLTHSSPICWLMHLPLQLLSVLGWQCA